jgi:tripartite-type tricarboxylate transporter receptor subunit TctC
MSTMAGIKTVHVSYRGGGPAFNDLIAEQIDFTVESRRGAATRA